MQSKKLKKKKKSKHLNIFYPEVQFSGIYIFVDGFIILYIYI